ncbi:MAG: hypothetical protein ABI614_15910, partial [Planctomycetota bacterium]
SENHHIGRADGAIRLIAELLVDYGLPTEHVGQHHAGHAVYTRLDWLLFHAEEIARRFYGLKG